MNCRALTLCLFCSIGLHAAPVDLPALFDKRALVKPITELEGILSDGTKATVYKIVVRSLPFDHAMGPWAPATLKDKGGYWEDTVDKKLYRVDADYLRLLNKRGWNMFDADGTVHRTKDRSEFDKVARQELAGWTYDQAAKDGGKLAIGVDSNQNHLQPGTMLTSMLKRVDVAVYNVAMAHKPGLSILGLKEGGVDYAIDSHNAKLVSADMKKKVDAAKADIISGKIKVADYMADNACKL